MTIEDSLRVLLWERALASAKGRLEALRREKYPLLRAHVVVFAHPVPGLEVGAVSFAPEANSAEKAAYEKEWVRIQLEEGLIDV